MMRQQPTTTRKDIFEDYIWPLFDPKWLRITVKGVCKKIEQLQRQNPFDSIAVCGTSGLLLAGIVSHKLGIPLNVVSKENERSHHQQIYNRRVRGFNNTKKYIILDDFVCGGSTVDKILNEMSCVFPHSECLGIVLYNDEDKDRSFLYTDIQSNGFTDLQCKDKKIPIYSLHLTE